MLVLLLLLVGLLVLLLVLMLLVLVVLGLLVPLQAFSGSGLRPEALVAAYGLAEHCLAVTDRRRLNSSSSRRSTLESGCCCRPAEPLLLTFDAAELEKVRRPKKLHGFNLWSLHVALLETPFLTLILSFERPLYLHCTSSLLGFSCRKMFIGIS